MTCTDRETIKGGTMKIKNRLALIILAILLQIAWIAAPAEAATFTVTSAADAGPGTLRWAIEQANASAGADNIFFDASYIISPWSELPVLSDPSGGTTIDGENNSVTIDGSRSTYFKYGLKIASDNNFIRNLYIRNFRDPSGWGVSFGYGVGIYITGKGNTISSCKLYNNGFSGIVLGTLPSSRELFAANGGREFGGPVSHNRIQGCYIGTADGVTPLTSSSPQRIGIFGTENAFNNFIGVDSDGYNDQNEGNVISGNWYQIELYGQGNFIAGNMIGTDSTGSYRVNYDNNSIRGIMLHQNAFYTTIGTNSDGISDLQERNIISGNGLGIENYGYTSGVRISGNYFGTNANGDASIKNVCAISISMYPYTPAYTALISDNPLPIVIGTNGDGINDVIEGNVIAGSEDDLYPNSHYGIELGGQPATASGNGRNGGVKISGNLIGTDASGTRIMPMGFAIRIYNSSANIIGTDGDGLSDELEGNVIASPVYIEKYEYRIINSNFNRIAGNNFGVDRSGKALQYSGVLYHAGSVRIRNGSGNIIGTNGDGISDDLEANVFANTYSQNYYDKESAFIDVGYGSNNRISGNIIGMGIDGLNLLGDGGGNGIFLMSEKNSLIGTDGDGISDELEGNILLGNHNGFGMGVSYGSNNRVSGNYIGTNPSRSLISGFGYYGLMVNRTTNNLIGTNHDGLSDDLEANVITDNGHAPNNPLYVGGGIKVIFGAYFNSIQGNSIYNNIGMGIDLIAGGNYNFAAPVITNITHNGASFVATGTAPVGSMVEIFIADSSTVDGGGEGKTYLDRVLATDGTFTFDLNNIGVDEYLTATATDVVNGNTSEFSQTRDFSGHLPPAINSIADQTVDTGTRLTFGVTATSPHGLPVVITTTELPAGVSFDGTNFSWTPEFNQAGLTYVTFVANDGQSTTAKTVMITVNAVNSPPVLAITGAGVFNLQDEIVLGAEVSDADGDQLTYSWSEGATILCSGSMTTIAGGAPVNLPNCQLTAGQALGTHIYGLEINDGYNLPVTGTVAATVQDSSAPTLAPTVDRTLLWPPNHEMVAVFINSNATDDSGCLSLDVEVSSNEPESGMADGDNFPDFSEPLIDPQTGIVSLQLRAERDGRGDGRIYQVAIIATDCAGNSSTTTLEVLCPHDKKDYSNQ